MLHRSRAGGRDVAAGVLALARFGTAAGDALPAGALAVTVPLAVLGDAAAPVDRFEAHGPVHRGRHGDVDYVTDGSLLVGCVQLDERAHGGLRAAARHAYRGIFDLLDAQPCRAPLRFWNYVPHINAPAAGLERYRHFNIGRQEAFLAAHRAAFAGAPAACALGSFADALVVYFVAAREAPEALENPRQVSAYRYPSDYGPRAPTFSRASLLRIDAPVLFISGTASIVGHQSLHAGDPVAQTVETFVNLRAMVQAANARAGADTFALERCAFTVYVRRRADFDAIRAQFLREVGATGRAARDVVFLQADICRAELLVEIEATAHAGG